MALAAARAPAHRTAACFGSPRQRASQHLPAAVRRRAGPGPRRGRVAPQELLDDGLGLLVLLLLPLPRALRPLRRIAGGPIHALAPAPHRAPPPPVPAGRLAGAGSPRGADRRGAGGGAGRRGTAGPPPDRSGRAWTRAEAGRRGHGEAAAALLLQQPSVGGNSNRPMPANAGRTAGGAIPGAMPGSPARPRPSDSSPPVPRPPFPPPSPLPSLRRPHCSDGRRGGRHFRPARAPDPPHWAGGRVRGASESMKTP